MLNKDWRPPLSIGFMAVVSCLLSALLVLQEYVGFTYSHAAGESFDWTFMSLKALTGFLLWPFLCPLIYRVSRVFARGQLPHLAVVGAHLLLSVIVSFLHRVFAELSLFSAYFVVEGHWYGALNEHTYSSIFVNIFSSFLIYWILVGVFLALDYYREYQHQQIELVRMENELNNAQLQALKMQLHPHFLFNTLHTISSLMDENIDQAQTMMSQLGYLLRSVLDQEQQMTISLKEEMRYIRSYLDIEQTRFRDRLKITYDVPDDTLAAQVPTLILQPLVENAIQHGFSRRTDSGTIRVSSKRNDGRLELRVQDDGRGVPDVGAVLTRSGIGLQNVGQRLQQMYQQRAELSFESPNQRGFIARISIPLETRPDRELEAS